MSVLGARLGWRLPCLDFLRLGRSQITWRSYTASTDANVDVKSESESGTEKLSAPYKHRKGRSPSWTPEEIRLVYKLADDGFSHHAVAARIPGRSYFAVAKILYLRQSGAPMAPVAPGARRWSPQETEELLSLSNSGASFREIAKILPSRSEDSIISKLRNLIGSQNNTGQAKRTYRPWTADETARLHRLAQEGFSMGQVAEKLDRTRSSIDARFRRTRTTDEHWPSFPYWTPQDEAELIRMGKAGFSLGGIAKALHRSLLSCKQQWKMSRPRDADGIVSGNDDRPNLSDTDFTHIAEMRKSGTSWNVIQQSMWPDFGHRRVREAFQKASLRRMSEFSSRPLSGKFAARQGISDADLVLIQRMREEGDSWATISCSLYPETPYIAIDKAARVIDLLKRLKGK